MNVLRGASFESAHDNRTTETTLRIRAPSPLERLRFGSEPREEVGCKNSSGRPREVERPELGPWSVAHMGWARMGCSTCLVRSEKHPCFSSALVSPHPFYRTPLRAPRDNWRLLWWGAHCLKVKHEGTCSVHRTTWSLSWYLRKWGPSRT